jgi:hypothetical protein
VFTGSTSAQRLGRTPQVNAWWSDSLTTRLSASVDGEMAYLDRRPDLSQPALDRSLWRFHGTSRIRAALSNLSYLSFTTSASWRVTSWLESLDPLTGLPVPVPVNRNLLELSADLAGPWLQRIFQTPTNGYAERFKHLIEPRVSVHWLSPFTGRAQVIQTDPHIDGLVGGTTQVHYSLATRVLARTRVRGGGPSQLREILSVTIGQRYYTNAQAGLVDPYSIFPTATTFTPVEMAAVVNPFDAISGRFQLLLHPTAWVPQSYSATATIRRDLVQLSASWSRRLYLPGVPNFDNPALASQFLNATTSMTSPSRRYGGSYGVYYDVTRNRLVMQRVMAYISAQCCGLSVEYQTINIAPIGLTGLAADRRVAISFTLAGIGSFPIPLGAFRQ